MFKSIRKAVWKTRKRIRKTIRNAIEKCLAPLRPTKNFSPPIFHQILKVFHHPKFAQKKKVFFSPRGSAGGATLKGWFRDGPNTTTTTIIQKSFESDWCHIQSAFDGASDEKSMCALCVLLCRRGIWCVPQSWRMGFREMSSKMVVVVFGPSLIDSHWGNSMWQASTLRWHVCRANFARKFFFESRMFSQKMLRNFPRTVWAFIVWFRTIPQHSRQNFLQNLPPKNQNRITDEFCMSAGRTVRWRMASEWWCAIFVHSGPFSCLWDKNQGSRVFFIHLQECPSGPSRPEILKSLHGRPSIRVSTKSQKRSEERWRSAEFFKYWSATNAVLRDWGLSKSKDIWEKSPFFCFLLGGDFQGALWTLRKSAKGQKQVRKRPKKADLQEGQPDTP